MKNGLQSTSRQLRVCMTLLVCLMTTAFMALEASASVDALNQWPATPYIVSNANVASVSGKFTVSAGSTNRLMLVAVAIESTTAPTVAVTYGGQTVNQILLNTTGANRLWIGQLNNAGIVAAGTNKTLTATLTGAGTVTATYVTAAVYDGVDQGTPITGFNSLGTTTAAPTIGPLAYTMTGNVGLAGNNGLSVYLVNWNNTAVGQTTPSAGYTEVRDYVPSTGNFSLSANYKVTTGASAESITSTTTTAAIAALGVVGLNPALRIATIASCSDCHGYPPNDAPTNRNVPPGQFVGAHDKHSGNQDQLSQYGYACTKCHKNVTASDYKHQTGFKNISGTSLPRTAYNGTSTPLIPMTNTPQNTTCGTNACHSTGRSNAQFTTSPAWSTTGTTTCLSCHAGRSGATGPQANSSAGFKLSSSHSQHLKYLGTEINCNQCHGSVATNAATLKNYSGIIYHANGTNNVVFRDLAYGSYTAYKTGSKTCQNISCHGGKTKGGWLNQAINTTNTCVHCHGVTGTSAGLANTEANRKFFAPGYGGGTSTDQLSVNTDNRVGAHFVHLSSVYSKRTKCNECHLVPATAFDGSHMTGPRFSSQSLNFTQASTAKKNSAPAAFTSGTAGTPATCATTYCHGNNMPKGDNTGTARSVNWNDAARMTGSPGADCATCHGNPPLFGSSSTAHIGSVATTSCAGCHKTVANPSGAILNKTLHINGAVETVVDTALASSCNKCHGNPPQGAIVKYGRYSGLVKPAILALGASPANMGAHAKHASKGLSCNACHTNSTVAHPDAKLQIFFRITSATITGWNATAQRAPYGTYSGNSGGMAIDTSSTLIRTTANTRNSCNTYCHGGWTNSNRNMNPSWTDTGAATACGACHGSTAVKPPLIASHARHAGYSSAQTARQGYSIGCLKCHPNRSTSDHIKGAVHVRFSTAVLGATATYNKTGVTQTLPAGSRLYTTKFLAGDTPDGTCSNINCHSNARGALMGTTQYATTAQWGSTTRNCLACHGGRSGATGTGAPARSTSNFTLSTTHSQHLKYPAANMNCTTCHSQTSVTDGVTLKNFSGVKRHANGKRDVTFSSALAYGTYTSYKSTESGSVGTTKTCNNVSCHGGKSRSAWSATAQNNDNTCLHCHGVGNGTGLALRADRYNSAPGWAGTGISTDGIALATNIRVGAHFKHLSSSYVKKMKCNECHLVPTGPFDGTHMATQRYNSQTLTFAQASTATKRSTPANFTAGTSVAPANCTNYCHGTNLLNGDTTAGTVRTPTWNQDLTTGGNCGKCHGNPPNSVTASHNGLPAASLGGCNSCHGMVVNATGVIINKALHMDGTIQVIAECNGCHDYDTNGGTWGLVKSKNYGGTATAEGRGAHYKHIEYLKSGIRNNGVPVSLTPATDTYGGTAFNLVCGVCHDTNTSAHSTGTPGNPRSIVFPAARDFGGTATFNGLYNTSSSVNPKSCSNLDCHYRTSPIWATY